MPKVAPNTAASTSASLINGRRACGSFCNAATPARRCRQPITPSRPSAMTLAMISQPYSVCSNSAGRMRTNALTTPLAAIATKHHKASDENRRAARSECSPRRMA
jgi:hypothetical protein